VRPAYLFFDRTLLRLEEREVQRLHSHVCLVFAVRDAVDARVRHVDAHVLVQVGIRSRSFRSFAPHAQPRRIVISIVFAFMGNCQQTCCSEQEKAAESLGIERPDSTGYRLPTAFVASKEVDSKLPAEAADSHSSLKEANTGTGSPKQEQMVIQFENGGVYQGSHSSRQETGTRSTSDTAQASSAGSTARSTKASGPRTRPAASASSNTAAAKPTQATGKTTKRTATEPTRTQTGRSTKASGARTNSTATA